MSFIPRSSGKKEKRGKNRLDLGELEFPTFPGMLSLDGAWKRRRGWREKREKTKKKNREKKRKRHQERFRLDISKNSSMEKFSKRGNS